MPDEETKQTHIKVNVSFWLCHRFLISSVDVQSWRLKVWGSKFILDLEVCILCLNHFVYSEAEVQQAGNKVLHLILFNPLTSYSDNEASTDR